MPSSKTTTSATTEKPTIPVKSASRAKPAAPKVAAKRAPKVAVTPVPRKTAAAPADKKPAKARVKLVRDGFTMPEADFSLIAELKQRALGAKREAKKSELLRAGLRVLAALDAKALLAALEQLEPVKTGRPKKGH